MQTGIRCPALFVNSKIVHDLQFTFLSNSTALAIDKNLHNNNHYEPYYHEIFQSRRCVKNRTAGVRILFLNDRMTHGLRQAATPTPRIINIGGMAGTCTGTWYFPRQFLLRSSPVFPPGGEGRAHSKARSSATRASVPYNVTDKLSVTGKDSKQWLSFHCFKGCSSRPNALPM